MGSSPALHPSVAGGGRKADTKRKARYVNEDDLDSLYADAESIDPLQIHPVEEAQIK